MFKTYLLLVGTGLTSMLGGNKNVGGKPGTARKKSMLILLYGFLGVYLGGFIGVSSFSMYDFLLPLKMQMLIPCIFFAAASLMSFISTMFGAHGFLFKAKDLEILFSLPVPHRIVLLSKATMLYVYNLLYTLVIFGVAGGVYLYKSGAGFMGILSVLIGVVVAPLLPLALGTLISYGIGYLLRGFRHRNAITTIAVLGMTVAYMVVISSTDGINGLLTKYGESLYAGIQKYYFPSWLLVSSMNGSILALLGLILVSVVPAILLFTLLGTKYSSIVAAYNQTSGKTKYRYKTEKRNSVLSSCTYKEIKRVLSSPTYLINSLAGVLMLVFIVIGLLNVRENLSSLEAQFGIDALPLLTLFCMMFAFTLTATTSCTISLEAKTLWIYKSAPIDEMTVFEAKSMANNIIYLPFALIVPCVLSFVFNFGAQYILLLIGVPVLALLCSSYMALIINLAFPKFDWQSETQAIKQGISVLFTMLVSFVADAVFVGGSIAAAAFLSISAFEIMLALFAILMVAFMVLRIILSTWGVKKFRAIY